MLLGKRCNTAVDMWSLGCMLAELYLGRCLFDGQDIKDQFSCIMKVISINGYWSSFLLNQDAAFNRCWNVNSFRSWVPHHQSCWRKHPTEITSDLTNLLISHNNTDSEGVPLNISEIIRDSTTLVTLLNSENFCFLDFLWRCLEWVDSIRDMHRSETAYLVPKSTTQCSVSVNA